MALEIREVSSNPPKSWKSRKTAKTGYKSKPTKLSLHRATALKFWQLFHHYVLFLVLKFQVCSSVKKQFPPKSAKSNLKKRPPWRQNSGLRGTLNRHDRKLFGYTLKLRICVTGDFILVTTYAKIKYVSNAELSNDFQTKSCLLFWDIFRGFFWKSEIA